MEQRSEFPLKAFSNEIVPASGLMTFERIQEKGQDASMRPHCGGFVPTSQDEHEISLSCLSLSLSSSLYPLDKPTLFLCLYPSLTNVKGRSSISVFESVKPVQKVATKRESKKWNFSRGMAICLGENNRRSVDFRGNTWGREHHGVSVWGHVYATRCNAAG